MVRRARGGGVASPTTTTGFVFFGVLGLALTIGALVAAKQKPFLLVALVATLWPIRDLLAWLVATDEERARFLAEVQSVGPSPSQQVVARGSPALAIAFGFAGLVMLAVCVYLRSPFGVFSLFFFALSVASLLDVIRRPPQP